MVEQGFSKNFLTVIRVLDSQFVLCKCDCGNITKVRVEHLRSGHTKSCGCYQRTQTSKAHKTHGREPKRLYSIWANMKTRCLNKNTETYERYGGRGITICDEWLSFENFRNWAITNGYSDDLTIDRIDNDGNYEPSNCRWATDYEQRNNTRRNHFLEYKGERKTIRQWSDDVGISCKVISDRVNRYGWTVEEALGFSERRKAVCKTQMEA